MTTQSKFQFVSIFTVLFTLVAVSYQAGLLEARDNRQANQAAAASGELTQATDLPPQIGAVAEADETTLSLAESAPRAEVIARPVEAVAMVALPSQSSARTQNVIKLYKQPDSTGQIAKFITPGLPVAIRGRNANGSYLAVTNGDLDDQVIGWIAAGDLALEPVLTHPRSLAKVYHQPNMDNPATSILTPNQVVSLLGTNSEKTWYAVASMGYEQRLIGWIQAAELSLDAPAGEMLYLTKTHLKADEDSSVVEVLWPTMKVAVLGRSQDGNWLAVASQDGSKFRGWALTSEVKVTGDIEMLPILTSR